MKKSHLAKALPKSYLGNLADMPTRTKPSTTKDIDQTDVWAVAAPNELGFSNVTIHNVISLRPQEFDDDEAYDDFSGGDSNHKVFRCNVCLERIIGFRYRCCTCPDFEMCSTCEARGVHPLHYVLRAPGFSPPSEVSEVIEAVRLALTRQNHEELFTVNNNNSNEPIDPLDDDCTISLSSSIADLDPVEHKVDPLTLLTTKKLQVPKELKIEYLPNPVTSQPIVLNAADLTRIPLALKKLPANVLPPANAIIRKIRIAPRQEQPKRKKSVKLKLIGKKNLPVALDAMKKKVAVRLRPLPDNIKKGVRVIIPRHCEKAFL